MPRTPESVIQAAVASYGKWSVPASVSLAQWALESNYGNAMPIGSNNPFGIKAKSGESFVWAPTHEFIKGKRVLVQDKFRKFVSLDDAFNQHAQLLATAPAYMRAMAVLNSPDAFADALTGVYATDPHYGSKLKSIMRQNNYYQYDKQRQEQTSNTGKTALV